MPRPAKKKTEVLSEATKTGELRAIAKANKKKPILDKVLEYIKPLLVKVDPLEAIAVIGGTIAVHEVLMKGTEFTNEIQTMQFTQPFPANWLWSWFSTALGLTSPLGETSLPSNPTETAKPTDSVFEKDWFLWLMAFAIAFYAVRHGAELMNVAKMFFGKI